MSNPKGINQYTGKVRSMSSSANKRAKKLDGSPEGLKQLREAFKHTSRYQAASALRSARAGGHWSQPKLLSKAVKEAAAAQTYRNAMRSRGVEITGGAGSTLAFKK